MKLKTIRQQATFSISPRRVYDALMDSKQHARFTGASAKISRKVGGTFRAYGTYIVGKNLALSPGKKIVQSWRETRWPKGHFSTATFLFKPHRGGAKLLFTQTGVPAKYAASIKDGWREFYWNPMEDMFKKRATRSRR
ncbi:SRPBCC domain-containing protein [Candidatus Uhrbacteria bacterium]|nr:SRPBCC domain-containing protein [Candidatus Uhrbacteria bacterium]